MVKLGHSWRFMDKKDDDKLKSYIFDSDLRHVRYL